LKTVILTSIVLKSLPDVSLSPRPPTHNEPSQLPTAPMEKVFDKYFAKVRIILAFLILMKV